MIGGIFTKSGATDADDYAGAWESWIAEEEEAQKAQYSYQGTFGGFEPANEFVDMLSADNNSSTRLISVFMIICYCQEELGLFPISDESWYKFRQKLLVDFEKIVHPHKELLSEEEVEAGVYVGEFPLLVAGSARSFLETYAPSHISKNSTASM